VKVVRGPRTKTAPGLGLVLGLALVLVLVLGLALAACGGPGGGRVAWVTTQSFQSGPGDTITSVDLAGGEVGSPVTTASEPSAMTTADGGRELVVTNRGNDTLSVVDTATGSVTATVRVGMEPDAVAVLPAGAGRGQGPVALVADFGADSVTPVDLATMRSGAPIPVGQEPDAIAVLPAGGGGGRVPPVGPVSSVGPVGPVALVADFGDDSVTPIDLATMRSGAPIPVGQEPDAIAVLPVGDGGGRVPPVGPVALVADFGDDGVTPIGAPGLSAGAFIPTPGNPTGIAVAPDGTAWVVGGATLTPIRPLQAGRPAAGVAFTAGFAAGRPVSLPGVAESVALAGATTAWVALQRGSLVPVTLPTGRVGRGVTVGGRPSDVVITPG